MVSLPSSQPASAMHQHPQQQQSWVVTTACAPSWQPASRPTTAPQHQPPAAAPGVAQKRNPGGAHANADYGGTGAPQTGPWGEQKQGRREAGVQRVWPEGVRDDAACSRALSVLPPAPSLPAATQPAAVLATPHAHAVPVVTTSNTADLSAAAGSNPPAYSQVAAVTTLQPVNAVGDIYHNAARGTILAARMADSKPPADAAAACAVIPGKCTSAALTAGAIASATNANVPSANCGQHSALAGQADSPSESSAAWSSQAVVPQSGLELVPPTTAAMPALQGTAGSNLSSLTAEHGFPTHALSRFVSSASVSSKSEAAARHSSGLQWPDPLSRQLSGAQAACGDRHAHSVSTITSQAGTSMPQKAAGCALDPAKLKELESLHAAAQAAGLTPSWEDSENEDSDSSDSVFSGSGSGTGSGNGSGVASGQASFHTDVEEIAAGQSSQVGQRDIAF